jgi:hypothetical protein
MDLLERTRPPDRTPYVGLAAEEMVKRVKLACRKPWLMRDRRCLREGLLAFRFLSMAGYRPILRFAVERTSIAQGSLSAHCWIELGGVVMLNPPTPTMVQIMTWPGGQLRRSSERAPVISETARTS